MADSGGRGISRKRLLITSALAVVAVLIMSALFITNLPTAGTPAWADPGTTTSAKPKPFDPPHDCGKQSDPITNRLELWQFVRDLKPPIPKEVHFMDNSWVLKDGKQGKHDLLAIPRARVTGVECPETWGPNAFNLWKPAWEQAVKNLPGVDHIMLGINSYHGRKQDQLHIHATGLQAQAQWDLANLKGVPSDLSKWNTSMFVVKGHVYRIVRVNNLDRNVFELMHSHVAQHDEFQQSIAVVAAPGGGGFYILVTQGKPDPGEPQHNPEAHLGNDWGTEAIEDLIWRG